MIFFNKEKTRKHKLYVVYNSQDWMVLLRDISQSINEVSNTATGDLHKTLDTILPRLASELRIDAIAIWIVEPETNVMRAEYSFNLSQKYLEYFNTTDRITVGEGLVGRVISERKSKHVSNASEFETLGGSARKTKVEEEGLLSILASPLFVGTSPIGALVLYYKTEHEFSTGEVLFNDILANYVAMALKNLENFSKSTGVSSSRSS